MRLPPQQSFPSLKWISFADSAGIGDADINRLLPTLAALDLESLVLTDNQISNLAPFAQTRTGNLYLTNNQITDLPRSSHCRRRPSCSWMSARTPSIAAARPRPSPARGPIYIYTDCP